MWLYWIRGWEKIFPMKYHLEFDREAVISKYLLTESERLLTLDELIVKYPCPKVQAKAGMAKLAKRNRLKICHTRNVVGSNPTARTKS